MEDLEHMGDAKGEIVCSKIIIGNQTQNRESEKIMEGLLLDMR